MLGPDRNSRPIDQGAMNQGPGKLRLTLLAGALTLAACASNPPAPVEDRSSGDSRPSPETNAPARAPAAASPVEERYRVASGDTLYAIAFKRGIDFRDLAAWNGVG